MNKKAIWLIVAILILVLIGAFYLLQPSTAPIDDTGLEPGVDLRDRTQDQENGEREENGVARDPLVITHSFTNGEHRYSGTVELPTPCHRLNVEASVAESFPEQITLRLNTVEPNPDTVCIQVLDRATFDFTVTATEGARLVRVLMDGEEIPFEIIFEEAKG